MASDLQVVDLVKNFASFRAVDQIAFEVEQGSFFSILGPSGCGKTTLLRMIAGFDEPDAGDILIRAQSMLGVFANLRPVNLIFQHLALFPMMDVAENVAFGLRRRRMAQAQVRQRVDSMLERVGLPGFGGKKIDQLSGGQRQRVAIARALVLEPSLLLLDEPLGALDLKLREQMKIELKKLQREVGTTFVYITHDQSEALVMSDRVAVMNHGRFEQVDTPKNLYAHPVSGFVAGFIGENNSFDAIVNASDPFRVSLPALNGPLRARAMNELNVGEPCRLYIRPESVVIEPQQEEKMNRFQVRVNNVLFDGANTRMLTQFENSEQELMVAMPQDRRYDKIQSGDRLKVGVFAESCICF